MQAAFIMQARTRNNDYIGDFLVSPYGFPEEEKIKIYDFVNDKTKYIDAAPSEGIKITFCYEEFVVLGIGIMTENLYKKCQKEAKYVQVAEGCRRVYAFLGFVFNRDEIHERFDITYELLLEYYERYMSKLWETPFSYEPMKPLSSPYQELSFSRISDTSRIAVPVTSDMLKKSKKTGPKKGKERSNNFSIIAVVLIGISIAAVILGAVWVKNFVKEQTAQQIVLPKQNENKAMGNSEKERP